MGKKCEIGNYFHEDCGNALYVDHNFLLLHLIEVIRVSLESQRIELHLTRFALFQIRIVTISK